MSKRRVVAYRCRPCGIFQLFTHAALLEVFQVTHERTAEHRARTRYTRPTQPFQL